MGKSKVLRTADLRGMGAPQSVQVQRRGNTFFSISSHQLPVLTTLPLSVVRVYLFLKDAHSMRPDEGRWYHQGGYNQIARESNVSRSSVKRAVTELWKLGWISVEERFTKDGKRSQLSHVIGVPQVGTLDRPELCEHCDSPWHRTENHQASARPNPDQLDMFGGGVTGEPGGVGSPVTLPSGHRWTEGRVTGDPPKVDREVDREVEPSPVAPALGNSATSPAPHGAESSTAAPAGPSDLLSGSVGVVAPSAPPSPAEGRSAALATETAATGADNAPGGSMGVRVPQAGSTTRSGGSESQRNRGARRAAAPAAELVDVARAWLSGLTLEAVRDLAARRPTRGDVDQLILAMKRRFPADASARKREIGAALAAVLEHDAGDLVRQLEAAAGDEAARRAAQLAELDAEAAAVAEYEAAEARRARGAAEAVANQAGADPVAVDLVEESLSAFCRANGYRAPTWLDVAAKLKPTFAGDAGDGTILIATEPSREIAEALHAAGYSVERRRVAA